MKVYLAEYAGFCMGVQRAIDLAHKTAAEAESSVFVLHEIVHNKSVVRELQEKGVWSVDCVDEVEGGTLIISAHGVSPDVIDKAKGKGLRVVDTTCPLVSKIDRIVKKLAGKGYTILLLGDKDHAEVKGLKGVAPESTIVFRYEDEVAGLPEISGPVALVSQTTQNIKFFEEVVEKVKGRYPQLEVYNTICDATEKRQSSAMELGGQVDIMITVGSRNSANSKRLQEVASSVAPKAYLVDNAFELEPAWFEGVKTVGVTAGASTPDVLIQGVIDKIKKIGEELKAKA
ncbi:MAG: 4-hydroxy-3-methylbut-2-enyl diphosphate reductase [Nitrospirae bacterium]|nr:4-hydroxy-3-methylbut-2-enyl diphosphate reductase [Nitrospirota bacterium]